MRAVNTFGAGALFAPVSIFTSPLWNSTALPAITTGVASNIRNVLATAGIDNYAVTAGTLPAGLSLDPITGAITGTSTSVGPYDFTITATNESGNASRRFTGTVVVGIPSWSSSSLGTLTTGSAASVTLPVSGGTSFTISGGTLPAGLTLDPATGAITGTPTTAGTYSFTVTATTTYGSSSQTFSGTISSPSAPVYIPPAPTINSTTPPTLTGGTSVNFQVNATGGTNFNVTAGTLPAGLTLNSATGAITGTPTGSGPYSFTVTVTNAYGQSSTVTYSGTIAANPSTTNSNTTSGSTAGSTSGAGNSSSNTSTTLKPLDPIMPATTTSGSTASLNGTSVQVLIDGKPSTFVIVPNSTQTGLVVNAPDWGLKIQAQDTTGATRTLAASDSLAVDQGHEVSVSGSGYLPNSDVKIYAFSTPKLLGTVQTDAKGAFAATLQIASDFEVGKHTLQINGYAPTKEIRSASVGMIVAPAKKMPVVTTNSSSRLSNRVIPFATAKYKIGSSQIAAINRLPMGPKSVLVVTGYADSTTGQDDIRISLDRALEVKAEILKKYPNAQVTALGGGTTVNKLCVATKNKCAVVRVVKK